LLQFESRAAALDPVLDQIADFGAIALTSPRAALSLGERLWTRMESVPLSDVWAAGSATFAVARRFAAPRQSPAGTGALPRAEAMVAAGVAGPVLYPCGSERRDELPSRLVGAGRVVHEVVCYAARAVAVENRPGLICLGPATAGAARSQDWEPTANAELPTVDGVLAAIDCIPSTTIRVKRP